MLMLSLCLFYLLCCALIRLFAGTSRKLPTYEPWSSRRYMKTSLVLVSLGLLAGCGGGGGGGGSSGSQPPPVITVVVSPSTSSVLLGLKQQFQATVTGTNNSSVAWSVDGVVGGNSSVGTIDGNGNYAAPSDLPNPPSISVAATSQEDNSAKGTATVTITSDLAIAVATNPAQTVKVSTGSAISLVATVSSQGKPDLTVSWLVNGVAGGNTSAGTITSTGADTATYQAPATVPTPFTVTISAMSVADSSKTASSPIIVAGTIASVTQPVSATSGGTITLPDGSSVTIAAGVLGSDQSVTLSEVSYLPNQPTDQAITGVGAGLLLAFGNATELQASRAVRRTINSRVSAPIADSNTEPAFQFLINTSANNVSFLTGSIAVADFVDTAGDNFFTALKGGFNSASATVSGNLGHDLLAGVTSKVISGIEFAAANITNPLGILPLIPGGFILGPNSQGNTDWLPYSTCPPGKNVVLVHGMISSVQSAFKVGDALSIKSRGKYDNVLGFNYDWLRSVSNNGSELAQFLEKLSCSSELDVEAHSEGVAVSMFAIAHSEATVRRFVSLAGPIMGTPVADDSRMLGTFLLLVNALTGTDSIFVGGLSDLLRSPFTNDLKTSRPQDGSTLDQVRTLLAQRSQALSPQIVTIAGNQPQSAILQFLAKILEANGVTHSDGIIPVTSALAFPAALNGLEVYTLAPFPVEHACFGGGTNCVVSDPTVMANVATEETREVTAPSLGGSATTSCATNFLMSGPPGSTFSLCGSSYAETASIDRFELLPDGTVVPISPSLTSDVNGEIPVGLWDVSTDCSSPQGLLEYFSLDVATGLASDAVTQQIVSGPCGNPVPVITSVSPSSIPVGSSSQTVTMSGDGFVASTEASYNSVTHTPAIVSATQLTIVLSSSDLSVAGKFSIQLTNPSPGGGVSNVFQFVVSSAGSGSVTISPTPVTVPVGGVQSFAASVIGSPDGVTWSLQEGVAGGTIDSFTKSSAIYTAPATTGTFHLIATNADDSGQTAVATVEVVADTSYAVLHSFAGGGQDGQDPVSALLRATDGNFYGTTVQGGTANFGTSFRMNTSGTVDLLHSFVSTDGIGPQAALMQDDDGTFEGTTDGGGSGFGTVFRMTDTGGITTLHSFFFSDGSGPDAPVIQGTDLDFYGTTRTSGLGFGEVFKIDSSGTLTLLHTFTGTDGSTPLASVVQANDHNFYGTTEGGGPLSCGTVFKIDLSGNFTSLHSFSGADGCDPVAALIQGNDGNLYGTTKEGGAFNLGTVFKMDATGNVTVLHSFTGPDGNTPTAPLIQTPDGNFYSTTQVGGSPGNGNGTIFKMDASGNVTVLHAFGGPPDGRSPSAGLVQGVDGNLYGTTEFGGTNDIGAVFRLNPTLFLSAVARSFNVGASR
jgi:uncharacterized repeat protein (TIGR03803 family)